MPARLVFSAVILFALTAFAPAPLPKRARAPEPPDCSLASIQGTWRIVDGKVMRAGKMEQYETRPNVRVNISGNTWTFIVPGGRANPMTITIDHKKNPAQLTFNQPTVEKTNGPFGVGLIRRVGPKLQILYMWSQERPTSFDTPPDGFWLRTLERESEAPK